MAEVITESGMDFIADNTFHIEKSELYSGIGEGVRSVEFIRVIDDRLLFVEAKTSFPNPNNPSSENLEKFQTAIEDICEKFIHSLSLFSSVKVGVTESSFPNEFVMPEKVSLNFVFVIKSHELEWCRLVEKKLYTTFPSYMKKIWKPNIYVINQENAKKLNLT